MKNLLLFSPVLWLRKVILYLLVIAILLGVFVYFTATAPWVIKKAVDTFAPDYNISYSRIHGNILTGVEIDDVHYAEKLLAKHITLKWNPNALAKKKIIVENLAINHANVDSIKALVASFPSDSNESSESFDFSVNVKKFTIDLEPFKENGIDIKHTSLKVDNLNYTNGTIAIEKIDVNIDSNISKVLLKASLSEGKVNIENLRLDNIDTLALQNLFNSDNNESVEKEASSKEVKNPLIPHTLIIQNFEANTLSREFDDLKIAYIGLHAKKTYVNLETFLVKKGLLDLNASTNLSDIIYTGKVKNNQLLGKVNLSPHEALFTLYNLPIRKEAIEDFQIDVDASEERVIAKIDTKVMQLLDADKDAFNLDIDNLKAMAVYRLVNASLEANTTALLSTPYAKDIKVTNSVSLEETLHYHGDIMIEKFLGLDTKLSKPMDDLKIHYNGDETSLKAHIESLMIKGVLLTDDFKKADLHLSTKEKIRLSDYLTLPTELNTTKATLQINAPLSFEENATQNAMITIGSNVVNIEANVSYDTTLTLNSVIQIPENSLLKSYSDAVKWENLTPITLNAVMHDSQVITKLKTNHLATDIRYDLNSSNIDGSVTLGKTLVNVSGNVDKKLNIDSNINEIPLLLKDISEIYTLTDVPKVEGSVKFAIEIDVLKSAELKLKSPMLRYYTDSKSSQEIKNIDIAMQLDEEKVVLKEYDVTYEKQRIFSTKPSLLTYKDNMLKLSPLWVNDQLNAEGEYNLKTQKGTFTTKAKKFHFAHELIELDAMVDIKSQLDGNRTAIEGEVTLLGGEILYDLNQKTFASDSDIIIVQDMKKEEVSPFMDNLKVALKIKTKKPLRYHKDAINIKANVDLDIHKAEQSELLILGSVEILKGGTYIFENKKFVLKESYIYFTGNPNKPLLDMSVNYKALEYLVTIKITGSADLPHIEFSSKPSLNKEQILSLILFDTVEAAGTNSGDEMMKMMGGAMAKSALNDIGIKLDHLVLGEGNSVEVGKKLTNKITIIYVNGDVAEVKLKYEHGKRTESVIGASEISQSYDIVYKRDF